MSRIPLKYHTNVLFYTKYTHPMLICRGADARTDARMDARTDGRTEGHTQILMGVAPVDFYLPQTILKYTLILDLP